MWFSSLKENAFHWPIKKILIFLDEYILLINEGTFFPFESLVVEPRQPIS